MFAIPFVKPEQLEQARAMEDVLLALPESVVTFVGVAVDPTVDTEPTYRVIVGCSPSHDTTSCSTVVFMELRKRWKTENIEVKTFRGKTRIN